MIESRFYGYKHWTLEEVPRCFYVGKGLKRRPFDGGRRNHKWRSVVERFGLRIEVCLGPVTNFEACCWEIEQISKEQTYSTNHSHNDAQNIGCNFSFGGEKSAIGYKQSEKQIADRVAKLIGQKRTVEQRLKMKGREKLPEERAKLSSALKKVVRHEEWRKSISRGKTGKKVPKIGEALKGKKRRFFKRKRKMPFSLEHKANLRKAAIRREQLKRESKIKSTVDVSK